MSRSENPRRRAATFGRRVASSCCNVRPETAQLRRCSETDRFTKAQLRSASPTAPRHRLTLRYSEVLAKPANRFGGSGRSTRGKPRRMPIHHVDRRQPLVCLASGTGLEMHTVMRCGTVS